MIELGKIQSTGAPIKDAVHIAIYNAVAGKALSAGEKVQITGGEAYPADASSGSCGVVDPFLVNFVKPGERFWVFMNPGTVANLRHSWDHPDIEEEKPEPADEDFDDGCRGC